MRKTIILCLVFSFAAMSDLFAADGAIQKLHRGIVNVLTAPVEVPKQIRVYWIAGSQKTMHISPWLFCGFVKGLWMAPARMVSGLWDVITCPVGAIHGSPLLEPEYVFDDWPKRKKGVVYKNLWD